MNEEEKLDRPQQKAFLAAFAVHGTVRAAAQLANVGRRTHYDWLANDEAYKRAFERAKEAFAELLEGEVIRRAFNGVEKAVFYKGDRVDGGRVREYSDNLLMFQLKALRPEKYRDNVTVEHRGHLDVIVQRLAAGRERLKEHHGSSADEPAA